MNQCERELLSLVIDFLELSESLLKDNAIYKETFDEITREKEKFIRECNSKGA